MTDPKKELVLKVTALMFEAYPELVHCDVNASLEVSRQLAMLIGYTMATIKMRVDEDMYNRVIDKLREVIVKATDNVLKSAVSQADTLGKNAGFPEDKIQEVSDVIRSKLEKTTTH